MRHRTSAEAKYRKPSQLWAFLDQRVRRLRKSFCQDNVRSTTQRRAGCRFHRKWLEDIVDQIVLSHFELNFDYWGDNFKLAKAIHDHQSRQSVFWESERVVDIIHGFLEKWGRDGLRDPDLLAWLDRFRADKWQAARDFWQAMYEGMAEAFATGMAEPPHAEHGLVNKK